jgi:integrase
MEPAPIHPPQNTKSRPRFALAQVKPRRKLKGVSFLREEEIERLFSIIHSIRDRAIFRLAYHAGLRASEVGLLQLRDYDSKTDRIFIHRLKGSHSGHHHLMREEARALRAWLKIRGSLPGPIFLSKQKRPIDRTSCIC